MKITYKDISGEFITEEFNNHKEGEPTALDRELNSAYDRGDLYFTIIDMSGKSTTPAPKINLNPKFRDDEE